MAILLGTLAQSFFASCVHTDPPSARDYDEDGLLDCRSSSSGASGSFVRGRPAADAKDRTAKRVPVCPLGIRMDT